MIFTGKNFPIHKLICIYLASRGLDPDPHQGSGPGSHWETSIPTMISEPAYASGATALQALVHYRSIFY